MSIIIYKEGTKEAVEKQLNCEHDWSDTKKDGISEYVQCKKCLVKDRDVESWEDYQKKKQMYETELSIDLC